MLIGDIARIGTCINTKDRSIGKMQNHAFALMGPFDAFAESGLDPLHRLTDDLWQLGDRVMRLWWSVDPGQICLCLLSLLGSLAAHAQDVLQGCEQLPESCHDRFQIVGEYLECRKALCGWPHVMTSPVALCTHLVKRRLQDRSPWERGQRLLQGLQRLIRTDIERQALTRGYPLDRLLIKPVNDIAVEFPVCILVGMRILRSREVQRGIVREFEEGSLHSTHFETECIDDRDRFLQVGTWSIFNAPVPFQVPRFPHLEPPVGFGGKLLVCQTIGCPSWCVRRRFIDEVWL